MQTARVSDDPFLEALVGRWSGTERLAASPWAAAGEAAATLAFIRVAGGRGVAQDYEQRRDGVVTLAGHGLLVTDTAAGETLWWWLDSFGHPPLEPARGRAAGGGVVLERTSPRGTNRTTFAVDGEELRQTIEVRAPGSDVFEVLVRARYRRV